MSRTLSTNSGSLESLKVSERCGCSPKAVQILRIVVCENPVALVASYKIPAGTMASIANRIKMAKTSNVTVVVEAGGKVYSAAKEVKVTVGGCGG